MKTRTKILLAVALGLFIIFIAIVVIGISKTGESGNDTTTSVLPTDPSEAVATTTTIPWLSIMVGIIVVVVIYRFRKKIGAVLKFFLGLVLCIYIISLFFGGCGAIWDTLKNGAEDVTNRSERTIGAIKKRQGEKEDTSSAVATPPTTAPTTPAPVGTPADMDGEISHLTLKKGEKMGIFIVPKERIWGLSGNSESFQIQKKDSSFINLDQAEVKEMRFGSGSKLVFKKADGKPFKNDVEIAIRVQKITPDH